MRSEIIDILSANDPQSVYPLLTCKQSRLSFGYKSLQHQLAAERFLSKYGRLDFGWFIARRYAQNGVTLPLALMGRDTWVFRAFNMLLDWDAFYDCHIAEAMHLAYGHPAMFANPGMVIKAMLVASEIGDTPEQHLRKVAARTGLHYATVEAFESLFYNVLDRRGEYLYLSGAVYPQGRIPELSESYFADVLPSDLIQRAGYNTNNLDMPAYLMGIGDASYIQNLASSANVEAELERMIIGNGLVFSYTNLLNHRSAGMSRAQALLVARRQSGQVAETPVLAGLMPLDDPDFMRAVSYAQEAAISRMRIDAGEIEE